MSEPQTNKILSLCLVFKNIPRKIWLIAKEFIILWCQINHSGEVGSSATQGRAFFMLATFKVLRYWCIAPLRIL